MSECVETLKSKANTPSKLAMNKNNQMNTELENRRNKLQKEEFEKQIDSLKKQHEFSVKRLNNEKIIVGHNVIHLIYSHYVPIAHHETTTLSTR